jgi:hypothetical protein
LAVEKRVNHIALAISQKRQQYHHCTDLENPHTATFHGLCNLLINIRNFIKNQMYFVATKFPADAEEYR